MYRYSVDNAITYTSEDVVLFRESPFASWMERLTLENPEHGIPPDLHSKPPGNVMQRQDDVADTLRAEGKHVILVDWEAGESRRRSQTLDAMRQGVDFIVNGQLALGPLSGSANLLMRTSGYSELGDYLYIPCDTQAKTTLHSAFRLCFLADLLHSLQGQLPPQLLIIRSGDDLVPLQTEDHIYHYRAVKQRFMAAMRDFRKHRMPDPAESSHFGRWSDCAHEVLKQRMLREEQRAEPDSASDEVGIEQLPAFLQEAVGAPFQSDSSGYDSDEVRGGGKAHVSGATAASEQRTILGRPYMGAKPVGPTLAEQAKMINPGTAAASAAAVRAPATGGEAPIEARPDQGRPDQARSAEGRPDKGRPGQDRRAQGGFQREPFAPPAQVAEVSEYRRRASDGALENLQFIGSSRQPPQIGAQDAVGAAQEEPLPLSNTAPSPSLRNPSAHRLASPRSESLTPPPAPSLGQFYGADASFERGTTTAKEPEQQQEMMQEVTREPLPATERQDDAGSRSGVDRDQLDSSRPSTPPPVLATNKLLYEDVTDKNSNKLSESRFSDSLITSKDYDI